MKLLSVAKKWVSNFRKRKQAKELNREFAKSASIDPLKKAERTKSSPPMEPRELELAKLERVGQAKGERSSYRNPFSKVDPRESGNEIYKASKITSTFTDSPLRMTAVPLYQRAPVHKSSGGTSKSPVLSPKPVPSATNLSENGLLNAKHSSQDNESSKLRKKRKEDEKDPNEVLKSRISLIQKEKAKSIKTQREILDKLGIKLEEPIEGKKREAHIERVLKMKENGLQLEKITLEVEKRYETMFSGFNSLIESLKTFIVELLNEQKKELFLNLVSEKEQNRLNFETLENKLFETVFLDNIKGKSVTYVQQSLEAFKNLFTFSEEFAEEFYGMVSSRLVSFDIQKMQDDVTKFFGQKLSQSLVAPKVFPTELIRFFEQSNAKDSLPDATGTGSECGNCIQAEVAFPHSLSISKPDKPLCMLTSSTVEQDDEGSPTADTKPKLRKYLLHTWIDKRTILTASRKRFYVHRLVEGITKSEIKTEGDEMVTLTIAEGNDFSLVYESPLVCTDRESINSICFASVNGKPFILCGTSDSVLLVTYLRPFLSSRCKKILQVRFIIRVC